MFNNSVLTIGIAIAFPIILASCGGGSSDHSTASKKPSTTTETIPIDKKKPNNEKEDKKGISERLLANDTALPSLPENNNPLPVLEDEATIEALKEGIYEYGVSYLYSFGDWVEVDCKESSGDPCPTITEYRFDSDKNEIISKQWAYMPIHKVWLELEDKGNFVTLPEFNLYATDLVSDSFIDEIKFLKYPAELSKKHLFYKFGESTFNISGSETPLANKSYQSNLTGEPATYSVNAKQYQLYSTLSKGEIFIQEEFGELGEYSSAVDFRNAHVSQTNPTCLFGNFLVFNPDSLGATSYLNNESQLGECDISTIETPLKEVKVYEEGIKTVGDSKVIYVSNDNEYDSDTSSLQYLPAFYINNTGHVNQGKALQEGYAFIDDTFYVNKTAVKDWLKTKYNDPEALNLPSL